MVTDNEIKNIVEEAIPLNQHCEIIRTEQIKIRAKMRIVIKELLTSRNEPFAPAMQFKEAG